MLDDVHRHVSHDLMYLVVTLALASLDRAAKQHIRITAEGSGDCDCHIIVSAFTFMFN